MAIKNPKNKKTVTISTLAQVLEAKLPMSQKIITDTCSLAMNFKKLIPAERIAATMIPDRIRLLEVRLLELCLDEPDRKITKNRVAQAPTKANRGTETKAADRFRTMAM